MLFTYDDAAIVTSRFRDFCVDNCYKGIRFLEFLQDPNHFHFQVDNVADFDSERNRTRFINLCPTCGDYESVILSGPAYLRTSVPLSDGFFRTDLLFGSGSGKHPLFVIGAETKIKMELAKLKGLVVEPVLGG